MPSPQADQARESFYHLAHVPLQGRACQGLACFAARGLDPHCWQQANARSPPVFCLGKCYQGPARCQETENHAAPGSRPHAAVSAPRTVLLNNILRGGARDLSAYAASGGGAALRQALAMTAADLIAMIAASGLRGRGGAGFPAGRKWAAVAASRGPRKYVVANADEGDPGAFSDRILLEDDPFLLIEAMLIAARATGATQGYIYLRKEYPGAADSLRTAIMDARDAGWLGPRILDSDMSFELNLVIGQGSYVCGEETSLLNSIEGRRAEVRPRPPQITTHGLFQAPTLVNNVETLCAVPWIVMHGAGAYAAMGMGSSRGTKLLSLNSLFCHPGLYEVEFGMPLRAVVEDLGGGLRRGRLLGVMVGGPLAGLIPPALLDTPLGYEELQAIGCALGHGGVIAFNDDTGIVELLAEVFRFGALESCGRCTPCHYGAPELASLLQGALTGHRFTAQHWHALTDALALSSLCGHGLGLAEFARAIERHYPQELATCFA